MADLAKLPSDDLKRIALQWLQRVRGQPRLGGHLEWRHEQDLRDCRKIYFDTDDRPFEIRVTPRRKSEEGASYRVVYRLLPSDDKPEIAQVLAVGAKYGDDAVYARAARRLASLIEEEPRSSAPRPDEPRQ